MNRAVELPELGDRHIRADYLEGSIHVVPRHGVGNDAGKYCVRDLQSTCKQDCFKPDSTSSQGGAGGLCSCTVMTRLAYIMFAAVHSVCFRSIYITLVNVS